MPGSGCSGEDSRMDREKSRREKEEKKEGPDQKRSVENGYAHAGRMHREIQNRYDSLIYRKPLSFTLPQKAGRKKAESLSSEPLPRETQTAKEEKEIQQEKTPSADAVFLQKEESSSSRPTGRPEKEETAPGKEEQGIPEQKPLPVREGFRVRGEALIKPAQAEAFEERSASGSWKERITEALLAAGLLLAAFFFFSWLWPGGLEKALDQVEKEGALLLHDSQEEPFSDSREEGLSQSEAQGAEDQEDRRMAKEDKTELIRRIAADYPQIQAMAYNPQLTYRQGVSYAIEGLEQSQPLTDNVLYEIEGQPVYCDETLIRCLAGFNSAWIDYVNKGDRRVFQLINMEGEAASDAGGFNTRQLTEEFCRLEVGEIRRNGDTFYVWTHEQIQATRNGKTRMMEYDWIYTIIMRGKDPLIDGYAIDGYYDYS